jgi:hypothetical protein
MYLILPAIALTSDPEIPPQGGEAAGTLLYPPSAIAVHAQLRMLKVLLGLRFHEAGPRRRDFASVKVWVSGARHSKAASISADTSHGLASELRAVDRFRRCTNGSMSEK